MNKLSSTVTDILVENGFVKAADSAVCKYGIDVFLISASEIGSIVLLSLILQNSIETLLWLATFIPIRIYTGGYHADTRLRCFGVFIATYLIFSLMIAYIPIYSGLYLTVILLTMIIVLKWAPLQHKNKKVSEPEKQFFRKMSVIFVSIEGVCDIAILLLSINHVYAKAVLYGLFTAGISLLVGKIKNNYIRSN